MRTLFVTWGWRSHFYPLVPLAWAIRAAGHEVAVATHPRLVPDVASTGLAVTAVGSDIDFLKAFGDDIGRVAEPGEQRGDRVKPEISADGGIVRHAEAMVDDLVTFGRQWQPDIVVYDSFNIAAPLLAQLLGVPAIRHLWGPDFTELISVDEGAVTGPLAKRFGGDSVRLAGDLTIDPCPPAMQLPSTSRRQPIRFVPYNGTALMPEWLRVEPERPRICFTWGTLFDQVSGQHLTSAATVADAAAELDVELVISVTTAQRGGFTAGSAHVRIAEEPVALHLLLPTCSAIVHQGGAGTTMTAMACGVRQLVIPQITDQLFNAGRLAATGAGRVLLGEDTSATRVRTELATLLADETAEEAAAQLRRDNDDRPTPAAVASVLERLVAQA